MPRSGIDRLKRSRSPRTAPTPRPHLGPRAFTQTYSESKRVLRNNTKLTSGSRGHKGFHFNGAVRSTEVQGPLGSFWRTGYFPVNPEGGAGGRRRGTFLDSRRELGRLGKMLRVLSSGSLKPLRRGESEPEVPSAMSVIANSTVLRLNKEAGLSSSSSRLDRFGGKE